MVSVFDVTAFILDRTGAIQPKKLQKLVYYGQAWSLVRDAEPLFTQEIQAWRYGPVCEPLYRKHARTFEIGPAFPYGNLNTLAPHNVDTVEAVLLAYGDKPAAWLSDLTHREGPWLEARGELPLDANSEAVISHEAMRAYYSHVDSRERRIVMTFRRPKNPLIAFVEAMDEDDAALLDDLTDLDVTPEVAKLTAS